MGRVLVTGGAGFLGSHVAEALIHRGHDVTVLDELSRLQRDESGLKNSLINYALMHGALDGLDQKLFPRRFTIYRRVSSCSTSSSGN